MSKKKKTEHQNLSNGKSTQSGAKHWTHIVKVSITIGSIVIIAAVWFGLQHSNVLSKAESNKPTKVNSDKTQSSVTVTGGPSIQFPEPTYDFGTINQGDKTTHTFVIRNIGDEPLKIIKAKGS